jgi:hypothetical protein
MNKYNKIMEYFWLVIAIATALYAAYTLGKSGSENTILLVTMPFIAGSLFGIRRFTRKRLEKQNEQEKK